MIKRRKLFFYTSSLILFVFGMMQFKNFRFRKSLANNSDDICSICHQSDVSLEMASQSFYVALSIIVLLCTKIVLIHGFYQKIRMGPVPFVGLIHQVTY